MKRLPKFDRKPALLAFALSAAVGVAGGALAQQYPSTNPTSPPMATSPSNAGPTRSDASGGMATSRSTMPARTESADSAWQKLGSKGYVTKDDVKGLSGFSFEAADANHDGRLSQEEFRNGWQQYASNSGASSSMSKMTPGTSAPAGSAGTEK